MMSGKNQIQLAQQQWRLVFCGTEGRPQWKKKTFSFGHCPNHLPPSPLTPIWATWSFFSDVKIQDLKGEGDILKPKKQLKVQYIGIFEEIDSFY